MNNKLLELEYTASTLKESIDNKRASAKTKVEYAKILKKIENLKKIKKESQTHNDKIEKNQITNEKVTKNHEKETQKVQSKFMYESVSELVKKEQNFNTDNKSFVRRSLNFLMASHQKVSINIEKRLCEILNSIKDASISDALTCLVIKYISTREDFEMNEEVYYKAFRIKKIRSNCDKFPTVINITIILCILKSYKIEPTTQNAINIIYLTLEYFYPYKPVDSTKKIKAMRYFKVDKGNITSQEELLKMLNKSAFSVLMIEDVENIFIVRARSYFSQTKIHRFAQENNLVLVE